MVATRAEDKPVPDATPEMPTPRPVRPENIPPELRALPQWVVWRYTWKEDENEWTKPPYDAHTGENASSTNPSTWATFEGALAAYRAGGWDGVGFVLLPEDNLGIIDLDKCRERSTGVAEKWARDVVSSMNTYTEVSPSGTGLRIVCRGRKPDRERSKRGRVEIYDGLTSKGKPGGRYLTFTGHRVEDTPPEICERQEQLTTLYEVKRKAKYVHPSQMTDDEVVKAMLGNKTNGSIIKGLWKAPATTNLPPRPTSHSAVTWDGGRTTTGRGPTASSAQGERIKLHPNYW
jgi:hypothetical protein